MKSKKQQIKEIKRDLQAEVRAIQVFSTSVIFSAAAVASSTVLLLIPNLETLSLFFFLVGYRYGIATGTTTVLTSVTIFEMFASQVYGTGGLFPFLLKFPPFFLIMLTGVYFHALKYKSDLPTQNGHKTSKYHLVDSGEIQHQKILFQVPSNNQITEETPFTLYERILVVQLGLALTIVYDVITSLGILVFVPTWEAFLVSFVVGIPFFILHQISNSVLFATIPSIITALNKARPVY